jgi:hypothetical protein
VRTSNPTHLFLLKEKISPSNFSTRYIRLLWNTSVPEGVVKWDLRVIRCYSWKYALYCRVLCESSLFDMICRLFFCATPINNCCIPVSGGSATPETVEGGVMGPIGVCSDAIMSLCGKASDSCSKGAWFEQRPRHRRFALSPCLRQATTASCQSFPVNHSFYYSTLMV